MDHFNEKEFACPCCGLINYNKDSAAMLIKARKISGISYIINSACRCITHNKRVGGKETSTHEAETKESEAWDIKAITSTQRFKILQGLILAGFTRIGIAKTFIHADSDKEKAPCVTWLY